MLCVKDLYSTWGNFSFFPYIVFHHLRTEYIHLHLVFPAMYLHAEECSCRMISSTAHTRLGFAHWAPTGEVPQSKWDIQGESVGWAFVPAWDINESVVMCQSSQQQVLHSRAVFSL